MSLLEINNIKMNYHTKEQEVEAIKDINFKVEEGDFISILGPSGCGKSTLLNIMSGLLPPSSGTVTFHGTPLSENLDKIGYMFQKDHLFPWLSILNNITLGLKIKKNITPENLKYVDTLIKKYGLEKFKNSKPSELSGGMRQRVALIRTLALNPDILFLDEPYSALDYQTRLKVCDDIYQIIKSEKKTAVMVTHDISEAISTSDKVIVLTSRPASIKNVFSLDFSSDITPFNRRANAKFKDYFNLIWNELEG